MADPKNNQGFSSPMVTNILLVVLLFFTLISTCTNMSTSKRTKELQTYNQEQSIKDMYTHDSALVVKFSNIINTEIEALKDGVSIDRNFALYNFLIYEDDLDKGKISLSEIRNLLLKENNKEGNEDNTE